MAVKNDLKKLRKEQRLKQADLAIAVGMCEKSISNIELEKNPASLETALRLAAYFKVSVEDMYLHLSKTGKTQWSGNFLCSTTIRGGTQTKIFSQCIEAHQLITNALLWSKAALRRAVVAEWDVGSAQWSLKTNLCLQ